MGYSRQDYGDCGAASPGNSCYKTHSPGARKKKKKKTLAALRWEEIRAHALWEIKIAPHFCFIIYNVIYV